MTTLRERMGLHRTRGGVNLGAPRARGWSLAGGDTVAMLAAAALPRGSSPGRARVNLGLGLG